MSSKQRIATVLAGAIVAMLVGFLVIQSSVQEAETESRDLSPPSENGEPTYPTPESDKFVPGEIVVTVEEDATQADLREINQQNDATTEEDLPKSDVNLVDLPRDLTVREAIERYEASPEIEAAQPNYLLYPSRTPNDTYYANYLYGPNNTGQTGGASDADIDAPEAWDTTTGSSGTVVAVIDEGVNIAHPDLKNNIWTNPDEVAGNNIDDDKNGYVDDIHGWDFANNDASVYDPVTDPLTGKVTGDEHGTHVAGTIAAEGNNGIGVTGVNWQARIMPLKFLGANGGTTTDAIEALNYAVNKGVKISNNSWGGGGYSQALYDAINKADGAGHLFVAAAGNAGANNDSTANYPANYNLPNVISVAATDDTDALATFSNYGATSVDLAAPGVSIASTYPEGKYGYMSGTSMATPHVTGVAALLKSREPGLDDAQLRSRILESVDTKANLQGKVATGGRLNAVRALGIKPTGVSLSANPLTLTYGQATTLAGSLTSGGGALGGRTVILEERPVGTASFQRVGEATTASDGTFSMGGLKPEKNTDYRARFAGSDAEQLGSATSAVRRVNVKVVVSLNTAATNLKLGNSRTVAGTVRPSHGGSVTVAIKRNGSVIAKKKVALSDSRYSFAYKPGNPSTYAFSATYPKDTDHLGNRSRQKSFKVVK